MERIEFTKLQIRLWIFLVVVFAAASAFGLLFGRDLAHGIAFRFHEHAAEEFLADDNYRRAAEELKALAWLEPDNAGAVIRLADAHMMLGEWLEAWDWLETLENEPAGHTGFEYKLLMTQIALESEDEDANVWLQRLQNDPAASESAPTVNLMAAQVARRTGDGQKANLGFQRLLEQYPNHGEAAFHLARTAQHRLQSSDVLKHIRTLPEASSEFVYTVEFRRIQTHSRGVLKRDQALLDAGNALSGERLEVMGLSALNLGQWDRAMDYFEQALAVGGTSWLSHYWLGMNADARGDRETALRHFRDASEKQPGANSLARRNVDALTRN